MTKVANSTDDTDNHLKKKKKDVMNFSNVYFSKFLYFLFIPHLYNKRQSQQKRLDSQWH